MSSLFKIPFIFIDFTKHDILDVSTQNEFKLQNMTIEIEVKRSICSKSI